jgi:hypothetical protein
MSNPFALMRVGINLAAWAGCEPMLLAHADRYRRKMQLGRVVHFGRLGISSTGTEKR